MDSWVLLCEFFYNLLDRPYITIIIGMGSESVSTGALIDMGVSVSVAQPSCLSQALLSPATSIVSLQGFTGEATSANVIPNVILTFGNTVVLEALYLNSASVK